MTADFIRECSGTIEFLFVICLLVLMSFLISEILTWTRAHHIYDYYLYNYSYTGLNGPLTWNAKFPKSNGDKQSPIDISSNNALVVPTESNEPLSFSNEYHVTPKEFTLINDGHSVILSGTWKNDLKPVIYGGPLKDKYEFYNARFHWGQIDEDGSEHSIDSKKYVMELQALHVKVSKKNRSTEYALKRGHVAILSYLFEVTPTDNPYLEFLIKALNKVDSAFHCANLDAVPLSWYIPPFTSEYYSYRGSLTFPPCTEGVKWLINSVPLGISSRQLQKFRSVCGVDGIIVKNTRPTQELNARSILYHG